MKNNITKIAGALFLLASLYSTQSNAALYLFEDNNPVGGGGLGDAFDSISGSYDGGTEVFTWETTFSNPDVDGFWLVVSNGPNPKGHANQLAIMYGDLENEFLSVYVYDGQNAATSYQNQPWIDTYGLDYDGSTVSFSFDASYINGFSAHPEWEGVQFGPDNIGIWFHASVYSDDGQAFLYDDDELIENYRISNQSWYDKQNLTVTEVPEPAPLALLLLGLAGLGLMKRKK